MSIQHDYDTSTEIPSLMLDVQISNPATGVTIAKQGKIDTGADLVRVPEVLARRLTLNPMRWTTMLYGNDQCQRVRTYFAVIKMNGFQLDAEVYFCGSRNYILIGRTILNQLITHCHGKNLSFWFEDP